MAALAMPRPAAAAARPPLRKRLREVRIGCEPMIESIRPFTPTNYVGWNMAVPDVWRARYILRQLAEWEAKGAMPALIVISKSKFDSFTPEQQKIFREAAADLPPGRHARRHEGG